MELNKHNESIESIEITEENGTKHSFATLGCRAGRGGRLTRATGTGTVAGHRLARVGDIVTCEDGSEATIIDGAGEAAANVDRWSAWVGSSLSNGDRIVESLQDRAGLLNRHRRITAGSFDPTYVAPNYVTECV